MMLVIFLLCCFECSNQVRITIKTRGIQCNTAMPMVHQVQLEDTVMVLLWGSGWGS